MHSDLMLARELIKFIRNRTVMRALVLYKVHEEKLRRGSPNRVYVLSMPLLGLYLMLDQRADFYQATSISMIDV